MIWDLFHALVERCQSFIEVLFGAALMSLPFWDHLILDLTQGFQLVAAGCGAIIGVHGVWRIYRRYNPLSEEEA